MHPQRLALLVLSIISLSWGLILWSGTTADSQIYAGIFVRVGSMLAVLWLAYHQLATLKNRLSLFTIGLIVLLLLLVAARPRIFPIAVAVAVFTIFLNGLLRRLSGNAPRR